MQPEPAPYIPAWLRLLVRLDFLVAVALTVVAPLALLLRALLQRRAQVAALLAYWRSSSLLMVTVYLLIGERRTAYACAVASRLLIPWTLSRHPDPDDPLYTRWRRLTSGYCLLGATLNLPVLRCAARRVDEPLALTCRAYMEPAQEFGRVLHPSVSRARLGRVGDIGLLLFGLVAALLALVGRNRTG
jgi:hypothetical protein